MQNFSSNYDKLFDCKLINCTTFFMKKIDYKCKNDADLIINIRCRKKNNFLKLGAKTQKEQMKYLESYNIRFKKREEIYFKIYDKIKNIMASLGLLKLTKLKNSIGRVWFLKKMLLSL